MQRANYLYLLILLVGCSSRTCIMQEKPSTSLIEAYRNEAFEVGRALEAECILAARKEEISMDEAELNIPICKVVHSGWKAALAYNEEHNGKN